MNYVNELIKLRPELKPQKPHIGNSLAVNVVMGVNGRDNMRLDRGIQVATRTKPNHLADVIVQLLADREKRGGGAPFSIHDVGNSEPLMRTLILGLWTSRVVAPSSVNDTVQVKGRIYGDEHYMPPVEVIDEGLPMEFDKTPPHGDSVEIPSKTPDMSLPASKPAVDTQKVVQTTGRDSTIKALCNDMERLIAEECDHNSSEDLRKQYAIIRDRSWDRLASESDILNSLIIQASSYSVLRKSFGVLYPEDIWKFDSAYGSEYFSPQTVPTFDYQQWVTIVLDWGNRLLAGDGGAHQNSLDSLVSELELTYQNGAQELSPRKPKSRLVLSLATALPKVRANMLSDAPGFFEKVDDLSRHSPAAAFDYASQFAEGIIGMGSALVANFLKEIGLLYFVKVDVHLGGLIGEIAGGKKLSERKQFILSWLLAREADMEPFFMDKIFYVGGKYLKPGMRALIQQHRNGYQQAVNELMAKVPGY